MSWWWWWWPADLPQTKKVRWSLKTGQIMKWHQKNKMPIILHYVNSSQMKTTGRWVSSVVHCLALATLLVWLHDRNVSTMAYHWLELKQIVTYVSQCTCRGWNNTTKFLKPHSKVKAIWHKMYPLLLLPHQLFHNSFTADLQTLKDRTCHTLHMLYKCVS